MTNMIIVFSQQVAQPQPQYRAHPAPHPMLVVCCWYGQIFFKSEILILIKFYFDLFNTFLPLLVYCILCFVSGSQSDCGNDPNGLLLHNNLQPRGFLTCALNFDDGRGSQHLNVQKTCFFLQCGKRKCLKINLLNEWKWLFCCLNSGSVSSWWFLVLPKLLVYNVDAMKSYATFPELSAGDCCVCASVWVENGHTKCIYNCLWPSARLHPGECPLLPVWSVCSSSFSPPLSIFFWRLNKNEPPIYFPWSLEIPLLSASTCLTQCHLFFSFFFRVLFTFE